MIIYPSKFLTPAPDYTPGEGAILTLDSSEAEGGSEWRVVGLP
jgi:hypothetical protein